jgi:universal stress protein A
MTVKRIVVGTDFSDRSDAAMDAAVSMAVAFQAVVDVVHVVEPGILATPDSLGAMALAESTTPFVQQIDEALALRAAKATAARLVCQTNSLQGAPAQELVRHAEKTGADLIVVGTHGRTGLEHVVLGSVAERVVQHAHCPVLVIPLRRREAR